MTQATIPNAAISEAMLHAAKVRLAARRRHHAEMLALSLLVVAAAFILQIPEDGVVQIGRSGAFRLPPLCASRSLFGIDCPGCGLTRCFVLLAHGRWSEAYAMHRVGAFFASAILLQIPYRLFAIWRNQPLPLGIWFPRLFGWTIIAALIGNWALKQFGV